MVFLTTEVVPDESWGYRDQIATLVGTDAKGKITSVKVLSEFESPRYTKGLLADGNWFLTQFEEKDAGDNFILEGDIDDITEGSLTRYEETFHNSPYSGNMFCSLHSVVSGSAALSYCDMPKAS